MHDKGVAAAVPAASRVWLSRLLSGVWPAKNPEHRESGEEYVSLLAVMKADADFTALSEVAGRMHWSITLTGNQEFALESAKSHTFAVILCDRDLTANWKALLRAFIHSAPHSAVILLSNVNDSLLWEEVTSSGAYDVLRKPLRVETVSPLLSRAVTYWRLR
jgi:DNA-binding NtrC family response regulator